VAAADFTPLIAVLAVIGIIYGALVAMVQKDVKKLVAYSSVSHLGFVMLGLFAYNLQGIEGGILQMINHGVSTGALFLIVGIIYERRHTRLISEFGGLSKVVPVFAFCFMVITLSSIGLPGTNGFVGEFLILLGAFRAHMWMAVIAATGVILAAVYMLWMFQRVMFGKVTNAENLHLSDMNGREIAYMLPLLLFVFWIGIYPQPFLRRMDATVHAFIARVEAKKQAALSEAPPGEKLFTRYFEERK
jgi:NADH-quinone oxidoreductase subunit M